MDRMSELLLKDRLGELTAGGKFKPEYDKVRKIARVRTITILFQLDVRRIGYVFAFLHETGLLSNKPDSSVVSLIEANLSNINLSGADLSKANLSGAIFHKANLSGANLSEATLYQANLRQADLSEADLSGAKVTQAQLNEAKSLQGTIMPDRSKHW